MSNYNIKEEVWKEVVGYEGYYEVSNRGNVRSVDRFVTSKEGKTWNFKSRTIKPHSNNQGYLQTNLTRDGITKKPLIHRLVAEAFLGDMGNGMQVHHKNEITTDNRLENLEWVTPKVNVNYGRGRNDKYHILMTVSQLIEAYPKEEYPDKYDSVKKIISDFFEEVDERMGV